MKRTTTRVVSIVAILLLGGVVTGYLWQTGKRPDDTAAGIGSERQILYWTDPMVPGYRSDQPGRSPFMDMDLVPVYADESDGAPVVSIRPELVQNFGVRTHRVVRGGAERLLTAQGYLFREGGSLRVLADSFERVTWLRAGLAAEIRVAEVPGRHWNGVVESVSPDVDVGLRSLRARVRITNPDAGLRPNLYAEVVIRDGARRSDRIVVPRESLIRTGTRHAVVLALDGGRFQPVEVVPGEESGDWVEIRQGIKEGDVVVTSGQFLIDSEASVRASFQRMESAPADPHAGHRH